MTRKTGKTGAAGEPPPQPVRVEMRAGGCEIAIEAPDSLNTVSKKALELWHAIDTPDVRRAVSAIGFTATEAPASPLMPPELALPYRIAQPEGPDPDEDRPRHR